MFLRGSVLVACLVGAASLWGDDEPKLELSKLNGTWKCESFEVDGKSIPKLDSPARLVIDGDAWTWAGDWKAKIALDPATDPPVIDLHEADGAIREGICQVEGDRLIVCLNLQTDKPRNRPIKFSTEPGDQRQVIYFRRDAK